MSERTLRLGLFSLLSGLILASGCGPGSPGPSAPSRIEAMITGKVTAGGVPVSKGKVTVSPTGPPFVENIAQIQKDGRYEVKTFAGKNSISVVGTGSSAEGTSYNKAAFDVKEGSNTIDLALPLSDK